MTCNIGITSGIGFVLMTRISLTTGTAFIMWLGEQITERGVGNGMSLIIFAGIVVGLPNAIQNIYTNVFVTHEWGFLTLMAILVIIIPLVPFFLLLDRADRPIPFPYTNHI